MTYHPPPQSFYPPSPANTPASKIGWLPILGAILWPSFFAAGVATMVFFAIVDPEDLNQITWTKVTLSRELGYTLGFFMFWLCTSASSLFTWILLRPAVAINKIAAVPSQDI